ncbi:MAG: Arm DNA-binding domain-containing protein [Hyphomicrobiales bacterium]
MAKVTNKLTVKSVEAAKSRGRLSDGGGLYLNVTYNGRKAWVFRWKPKGGKVREMGLGPYPAISLAKARDEAAGFRRMIAEGIDPKADRDKEIEPTFK